MNLFPRSKATYLRTLLEDDARWLADEPLAVELITRYLKALEDGMHPAEPISRFQARLNLGPWRVSV